MGKKDFPVMLAKVYDKERVKSWQHMVVEPKLDGIRVLVRVDLEKESIKFFSRNGRELDMFRHLCEEVEKLAVGVAGKDEDFADGCVIDGEMISDTGDFGEIAGAIHRKEHTAEDARLLCFCIMPLSAFDRGLDYRSQRHRYSLLTRVIEKRKLELVIATTAMPVGSDIDVWVTVKALKDQTIANNKVEGGMIKNYKEPWVAKRTYAWMKIKDQLSVDVVVTGVKEGTGKYEGTLGALVCKHKKVKIQVSGMTDEQRHEFWKDRKGIIGRMIEVEYQEETVHGALRHPRFVRMRPDKEAA